MIRLLRKPLRISKGKRIVSKALLHIGLLGYLGLLFFAGITDQLGGDPVKTLLHESGKLGIILLLLTLVISPAARMLPCGDLMKYRRLLGVYAGFTAAYHLVIFALFELQLDWSLLVNEIIDRPYITVGFIGFLILLALTMTSPNAVRKKMGKRWQTLHKSVYLAVILALVHFTWSEKTLLQESIYYWLAGLLLLGLRVPKPALFSRLSKQHTPRGSQTG